MEKDVVLDIALEILSFNQQSELPIDIYLTRYKDTLISLSDRSKLAKTLNPDLFVSLHCNHSDNPNAKGIEDYVGKTESLYTWESIWLAFQLQTAFEEKLSFESRGVKFANFQVLREAIEYCPAVLVEIGFLSNLDESNYVSVGQNLKVSALLLLNEIIKTMNYE